MKQEQLIADLELESGWEGGSHDLRTPGLERRMDEVRRRYPELTDSALARIFRLPVDRSSRKK